VSIEDRVLALIQEGNPVPDPDEPTTGRLGAAAYLATLPTRSSEMTQTKTRETAPKEPKWRAPLVIAGGIAAVALIVFGFTVFSSETPELADDPVVTTVASAPTTIAAPPTTAGSATNAIEIEPAPPPVLDAEEAWAAIPTFRGGTGTFRTASFEVPFKFTTSERWMRQAEAALVHPDDLAYLVVSTGIRTIDETVAAFTAAHQKYGGEMTDPIATNVGGAAGMMFETKGLPWEVSDATDVPYVGEDRFVIGGGQGLVHVVDVNGTAVTIVYYALFEDMLADHLDAAQSIINSIVWKDLR